MDSVVKIPIIAFLVSAGLGVAPHAGPVDVRAPLDRDGAVQVELMGGSLRVIGWDREEVQVTGVVGKDITAVEPTGDERSVDIEFRFRHEENNRHVDVQLVLHLPRTAELSVDSLSAPVEVSEFAGTLFVDTLNGDIKASGARRVRVETLSGRIDVSSVEPLEELDVETLNGRVSVAGLLAESAKVRIETFSSGITLRLPADANADFSVSTLYGDLQSDFGGSLPKPPPGKEQTIRFSAGTGGAKVSISSFSGPVTILKQ